MTLKVSVRGVVIVLIIGIMAIITGVLVASATEAWFLVLLGWLLIPVFLKNLWDKLTPRKGR